MKPQLLKERKKSYSTTQTLPKSDLLLVVLIISKPYKPYLLISLLVSYKHPSLIPTPLLHTYPPKGECDHKTLTA